MKKIKIENIIYSLVILLIIAISIYFISKPIEDKKTPDLEVQLIDVGQAESILIRHQNHNILIDAGNNKDGELLVEYFKGMNIKEFDYIIGTHPHEDHIGGLDNVINNFDIKHVLMPDLTTNTKTFEEVLDAIENKNLKIEITKDDDTFNVGDLKFEVIHSGTNSEDLNGSSIVLRMDYKANSYLFTSDITGEVEKTLLDKNIDVDVYKVAHHSSTHSNTYQFLEKVTPKYAIISFAKENDYYYPHIKTINRLKKYTQEIYMTSELGTIIIEDDGENIEISSKETNTDGGDA
jgi:competence protein ComEC